MSALDKYPVSSVVCVHTDVNTDQGLFPVFYFIFWMLRCLFSDSWVSPGTAAHHTDPWSCDGFCGSVGIGGYVITYQGRTHPEVVLRRKVGHALGIRHRSEGTLV